MEKSKRTFIQYSICTVPVHYVEPLCRLMQDSLAELRQLELQAVYGNGIWR